MKSFYQFLLRLIELKGLADNLNGLCEGLNGENKCDDEDRDTKVKHGLY